MGASRVFFNDRAMEQLDDPPSPEPLAYHRKLPGYAPTPLLDAESIARALGLAKLWVKDESIRLGLPSFKILGASWGVYRALEEHFGGLAPWGTLDELRAQLAPHLPFALAAATDGNHGRAVARMARLLGFEARIFVPRGTARARMDAITSEGASCEVVAGSYDDAVARSAKEAGDSCLVISDTSWEGYEDVPRWVIEGYSTIFWEIDEQLGAHRADLVFIPIGVGALAAAAARHFRDPAAIGGPALVGVEPEAADCVLSSMEAGTIVTIPGPQDSIMAGLNCGTPSLIAWPTVARGYEAFVAIPDDRARRAMRMLADAGMISGETGAAALGGVLEILERPDARSGLGLGPEARVLVLSTEGATDPGAYERIVGRAPASVTAAAPADRDGTPY